MILKFVGRKIIKEVNYYVYQNTVNNNVADWLFIEPIHRYLVVNNEYKLTDKGALILPSSPVKKSIFLNDRVFVLRNDKGQFLTLDPNGESYFFINHLSSLKIWDIHYENMLDHYLESGTFNSKNIHFLTQKDKEQLSI